MSFGRFALSSTLALALVACGGSDSSPPPGTGTSSPAPSPSPSPSPPPTGIQQQLEFAEDVLNEWYLFPELLDNSVQTSDFSDVQAYLDARVAPARAQNIDRGFTFATSIAEENALLNSGASAGFGILLAYDTTNNRVFLLEAYEAGNGFQAGMDRGTELLGIAVPGQAEQTVSSLMASGGPQAVIDALGPSDPGVVRTLRFAPVGGAVITADVTKTVFDLDPISDRYGSVIIDDGGKKVGYLNLRTFIVQTTDRQLQDVFDEFRDEGITEFIIDLRYNGGGLVRIANLMGDFLRGSNTGQVWSDTVYRDSKSEFDVLRLFSSSAVFFNPTTESFGSSEAINAVSPTKIAFIGRGGTASASELVINSMLPYLASSNVALIGTNTFGKPVGQNAFDLPEFDLRIRATTFQTNNAAGGGDYYSGLASVVPNTCAANDDIFTPLGDPSEPSIATALAFLNGLSCTPISGGGITTQSVVGREVMQPDRPNAVQFQIPGVF